MFDSDSYGDAPSRRRFLLTLGSAGMLTLAGCSDAQPAAEANTSSNGTGDADETSETSGTDDATETSEAASATNEETAGEDSLDLREANVVSVAVENTGDGYRFDVTLYHDDDGEDGYANWWQIENRDGEQLGRRELLHAHGTQEFTRSETITLPEETTCVVVRGHDQTHGYGGQAMLVNVETGATKAVTQGSERQSLASESCP
ncbi:hypothetical protein AUR64_18855 [Haloprofundus marisrubri]|uniref:Uncharacterized protein n=1 Tax=Haloprofundus marisrubri TaxID=1514971 RepID=A0A0W1R4Z9_9EURY|nr:hypothetical protein [Haloprofundus marisrubri]KTG08300.1 hypothetical protein AUR64_18855 [Haloprofundus marisrubri]